MLIITILSTLVAFVLGLVIGKRFGSKAVAGRPNAPSQADADKIMQLIRTQQKVTNLQVQQLLGVSAATAERYLNVLEQQGLLTQHGTTGEAVYYTLNR